MKKLFLCVSLLLTLLLLASCETSGVNRLTCDHVDANDSGLCDKCSITFSDGKDVYDPPCQHRDADDNGYCDSCPKTYSDGKDVEHAHSFGSWIKYGYDANTPCEEQLFYRTCTTCGGIEWKNGGYEAHSFDTVTTPPTCLVEGYDTKTCSACGLVEVTNYVFAINHVYESEYSSSTSYHWHDCIYCDNTTTKEEHSIDADGFCSECNQPLAPTEGVIYDLSGDGTYAEVIGYDGTATKVNIASTYMNVPVTGIYNNSFKNSSITSVFIPDSITSIGEYAFHNCNRLTSVVIPDSVTSIDSNAFSYCSNLAGVVLGKGLTSIGGWAFAGCRSLTAISIPDNVTDISISAFDNCSPSLYTEYEYGVYVGDEEKPYQILIDLTNKNLSTYKVHPETRVIAYGVFENCERLYSIVIPQSVTSINRYAFNGCTSLSNIYYTGTESEWKNIVISTSGNSRLGYATRYYYSENEPTTEGNFWCYDLGDIYVWPEYVPKELEYTLFTSVATGESHYVVSGIGNYENTDLIIPAEHNVLPVKEIADYAFFDNINIKSVTIEYGITEIGAYAFSDCFYISSVVIPESVHTIGDHAFSDCELAKIIVPKSVTNLGNGVFSHADFSPRVYYCGTDEEWSLLIDGKNDDIHNEILVYFYSENEPSSDGNYWYYDADGNVANW